MASKYLLGGINMRDYNFRRNNKIKEQERRKEIYKFSYKPTMPNKGIDEDGNEYYIEGIKSLVKKSLMDLSNKKVRAYKGKIPSGANYKKIYDLQWNWY